MRFVESSKHYKEKISQERFSTRTNGCFIELLVKIIPRETDM